MGWLQWAEYEKFKYVKGKKESDNYTRIYEKEIVNMKKCMAMLLTLALLLTLIPLSASAAESPSGYESLVQKAVSAFPEHANKLQNPDNSAIFQSRGVTSRELLISETRPISDREYVTYAEYSDGLILLSGYEFTADTTTVSYVTGSTYRNITIDIEATCVNDVGYNGYFYLEGVSYSLRDNEFDVITNPGTASRTGYCTSATRTVYTANESNTTYARIAYALCFQLGPTGYYTVNSELLLYVGEDTAVLDHVNRT